MSYQSEHTNYLSGVSDMRPTVLANGTLNRTLSANAVNSASRYNIAGKPVLSVTTSGGLANNQDNEK